MAFDSLVMFCEIYCNVNCDVHINHYSIYRNIKQSLSVCLLYMCYRNFVNYLKFLRHGLTVFSIYNRQYQYQTGTIILFSKSSNHIKIKHTVTHVNNCVGPVGLLFRTTLNRIIGESRAFSSIKKTLQ